MPTAIHSQRNDSSYSHSISQLSQGVFFTIKVHSRQNQTRQVHFGSNAIKKNKGLRLYLFCLHAAHKSSPLPQEKNAFLWKVRSGCFVCDVSLHVHCTVLLSRQLLRHNYIFSQKFYCSVTLFIASNEVGHSLLEFYNPIPY